MTEVDPTVLAALSRAPEGERQILLCFVAGRDIAIPRDEVNGALRRAELLLAAGGDPRRPLEPDGRAVTALADDLDTPARRDALTRGLRRLGIAEAKALSDDPERAWRSYATALLADALSEEL